MTGTEPHPEETGLMDTITMSDWMCTSLPLRRGGHGLWRACRGWPRRRASPTRGIREPYRASDKAGDAAEASPGLLLRCRPLWLWAAQIADRLWA
jgi:hypothetical protein